MRLRFIPLVALTLIALAACDANEPYFAPNGELVIEDLVVGSGDAVVATDSVVVNYTGQLFNETVFDTGEDVGFRLNRLIEGFRTGIIGMQVGGNRKITIPSELGYGVLGNARAGIPSNATLIFDVELLEIHD